MAPYIKSLRETAINRTLWTWQASRWLIRRPGAGLERRISTGSCASGCKSVLTSATRLPTDVGSIGTATGSLSGGRPRTRFGTIGADTDGWWAMILRPGVSLAAWVRTVSRRMWPAMVTDHPIRHDHY